MECLMWLWEKCCSRSSNDQETVIELILKRFKYELCASIEPDYGLLDQLAAVLSSDAYQKVQSERTVSDRCGKLLDEVIKNRLGRNLLPALEGTRQVHVARYIRQSGLRDPFDVNWPLESKLRQRLRQNQRALVELVDASLILDSLIASDCISNQQKEHIDNQMTRNDKNRKLIDIIERRSIDNFNTFVRSLHQCGQPNVASVLTNDGVTLIYDAKEVSTPDGDVEIGNMFKQWLRDLGPQKAKKFLADVSEDASIVGVEPANSVRTYIFCQSVAAMQRVNSAADDGRLAAILRDNFQRLLEYGESSCGSQSRNTHVQLPIVVKLYSRIEFLQLENALKKQLEILANILLRAALGLFKQLNSTTSRAGSVTLLTLNSVCGEWRDLLMGSKRHQTLLQQRFKGISSPYRVQPKFQGTIPTHCHIWGMAVLNDRIFAVGLGSNVIRVFADQEPYRHLQDIPIAGLKDPTDIVAGTSSNGLLFIAGGRTNTGICRIKVDCGFGDITTLNESQWVEVEGLKGAWALSFSSTHNRLVITPFTSHLYLYAETISENPTLLDQSPGRPKQINLPKFMNPRHAVETPNGDSFVVCHVNWLGDDEKHQVSLIDCKGYPIRTFGDCYTTPVIEVMPWWQPHSHWFNEPWYVAVDQKSADVLVADRWNHRIVLLDPSLHLRRVILMQNFDHLTSTPERMCFLSDSESQRRLLVGQMDKINDYIL